LSFELLIQLLLLLLRHQNVGFRHGVTSALQKAHFLLGFLRGCQGGLLTLLNACCGLIGGGLVDLLFALVSHAQSLLSFLLLKFSFALGLNNILIKNDEIIHEKHLA
jgi:hypothetical protein